MISNFTQGRSIDYDALFTALCTWVIIFIIGYTTEEDCDMPLRGWLIIKALSLVFRLCIKSGFARYSDDTWFKILIISIKVFSVIWICVGMYFVWTEKKCYDGWTSLYIGVLSFIIAFIIGFCFILIIFIVAYVLLRRTKVENEELQQTLDR